MDKRSIVLDLVLDHLSLKDISSVENRMAIQKAIYLAQASGLPLGYNYGWYVKGPYSPTLTQDYYGLEGTTVPDGTTLKPEAVAKLDTVARIMAEPVPGLATPQKLELVASLRYLLKETGLTYELAKARIASQKRHLAHATDRGLEILNQYGLA
jgi:hypothetical protein